MVIRNYIICMHCGKNTGYAWDDFMYMVLTHDVHCPHCGKVIIRATKAIWTYNGEAPYQSMTYTL